MAKQQINELAKAIFARKEYDHAAATYRDVPDLQKIYEFVKTMPMGQAEDDRFAFEALIFVAEQYETMGRMSVAAKYRLETLRFVEGFPEELRGDPALKRAVKDLFSMLLRDRNYYVDDDCKDCLLAAKASKMLGEEEIESVYQNRMQRRRTFKNDPVEMSEEYLSVIDEVERKIDANKTSKGGMGSCFEIWSLKEQYLAEKGITWTSPALLNPRVRFD